MEQYINEHYFEEISLESLSLLAHINKYYLVHAFKAYKGISPIDNTLVKKFFWCDIQIITDIKKYRHGGKPFFIFQSVDVTRVLSNGTRHIVHRVKKYKTWKLIGSRKLGKEC